MTSLLVNLDPALEKIIISQLIHLKLQTFFTESDEEMIRILKEEQVDCMFYDIDIIDININDVLNSIKDIPNAQDLKTVLLTANTNIINKLLSQNVTGVLNKNTNYSDFIENLEKVILYLELESPKRKTEWFTPQDGHELKITFTHEDENHVVKVNKISSFGLQVKISEQVNIGKMYPGDVLNNSVFFLNKKIFYEDLKVDAIDDAGNMTLAFLDKKEVFLLEIANYIFQLQKQ